MPANRSGHGCWRIVAGLLLLVILAGCATAPPQPSDASGGALARPPYPAQPDAMRVILNIITTPVFLPLKAVVCAVTTVIAVPATAIAALSDPEGDEWQRQHITEGFAANCGPPYVLF